MKERQKNAGLPEIIRSHGSLELPVGDKNLRELVTEAYEGWLHRTRSTATKQNYSMDVGQLLDFLKVPPEALEALVSIRPEAIGRWRDSMLDAGLTNASVRRKLTAVRSLFSYLKNYGFLGANPAHSDFVTAPSVPRDGKTVGLSAAECRRILDAPDLSTPVGLRDRAIFCVLAFGALRVGELSRLRACDIKQDAGHRVLEVRGKGGKERRIALHPECVEALEAWLNARGTPPESPSPLFLSPKSSRGQGVDGFLNRGMSVRGVEYLVERYVQKLGLDPRVTVHSFRVTALTTARERGSDIVDIQGFAGHSDPRTTLTYIRNRDRLSNSPAYILKY